MGIKENHNLSCMMFAGCYVGKIKYRVVQLSSHVCFK